MNDMRQFIGLYPVSKTLRFELRPIGKTLEWIEKNKVLEKDAQKSEDYPKVKALIDEYHKVCIHESLKDVHFDWNPLKQALEENQKTKSEETKSALEKEQSNMRKKIAAAIAKFQHFEQLTAPTPQKLIDDVFPSIFESDALKSFNRFAIYFKGFQENRNNIYSAEAISTGVPYRLVHDNFPKFLADIDVFENIKETCPEVLEQMASEMQPFLDGIMVNDIFSLDFYNTLLTQNGIDFFNQVLGGVAEEGKQKYRGINEFTNLYRQQHPELAGKKKALTMIPLFKQILSDRDTLSFIPQQLESDNQLIEVLNQFHSRIETFEKNGTTVNILNELSSLTSKIADYNPDEIFLSLKSITDISHALYGKWNAINDILYEKAVATFGDPSVARNKKKIDSYLKKDAYSLSEVGLVGENGPTPYFSEITKSIEQVDIYWSKFEEWCDSANNQRFLNNSDGTELVKNLLDSYMEILHRCGVLVVSVENDLNKDFYNEFLPLYAELENVIMVYNRIRNYLTMKPSATKQFKLNFGVPSLGDGWDQNKERDNKTIILFKDGFSYLGIMNPDDTPRIRESNVSSEGAYTKMVYKLLPGPNKMLPKVFFSKKGLHTYAPSERILEIYKSGAFKKNSPSFSTTKLHELIDFFKDAINRHPDWSKFDFVFSPTESYEDISAFYNEIAKQAYKIRFTNIAEQQVNDWVNKGQIYLFQLYNKDYAEGAHGRKNLHTLYWENLFTPENLNNLVLKLNGQAELFYRPQSIQKPIKHEVGSKMLNRRDKSGMPIPDAIYRSLFQYFNGRKKKNELTAEEKSYIDQVIVKETTHEIIKDRRYTKPEFFFHVPITFNINADGNEYINEKVLDYLKDNPDVNIIGIDRGERHLIYLTLINQRGEILKQKTFNMVGNYNYHAKLEQREKERDDARKSWQSVGRIKELKEGFLSAVIHEIAVMMVEYNAIVVLEDLNFGFKRGRFKVERQVYQKFEKMLIDKLNYLSFKDRKADEEGGILRGYQLARQFTSFQRLGKQSGFLFYIPAAYTSKIDPITGFVNHFDLNDITNAEKRKAFFVKMERIEVKNGNVEFEFDYRKFKTFQTDFQNVWTINTSGKRIVFDSEARKAKDVCPTKEIVQAFANRGIALEEGVNLKEIIAGIEPDAKNAALFASLFYAFKTTLQVRNSNAETEEDYILSPVAVNGKQFCTTDEANKGKDADGNWLSKLPVDADANGAYHIALKGLYLINNPQTKKIENEKWFQYMVEKPYLK